VLFSVTPHGVAFQAATGSESARLAQCLESVAADLDARVQGPCVLAASAGIRGDLDGLERLEPPRTELLILAERVHRALVYGLVVPLHGRAVAATSVRFAHSVFRDLTRWLRDRDAVRPGRTVAHGRWESCRFGGLVGASRAMRRLFRTIEKLAVSDVNVLVLGESGTGKELVARAIHESGRYAGRKFVAQNCAALPEALLESELFGHCRGAFTGANLDKRGLFEEANGGTFFLDEIADMPLPLQIKLLRVLQEGEIRRVGETRTRSVSVRIIAATNKRLLEEVARGRFREDLYYRLNVVKLELSPLRRRKEDVPLLARYFCDRIAARLGKPPLEFAAEVEQRFLDYDWPGNVRELENEIERLVALHGDSARLQPYMLSERLRYGIGADFALERLDEMRNLNEAIEFLERAMIARGLERHGWNKSRAATELGISRQGLIKKIARLQLVRPGPPRGSELSEPDGEESSEGDPMPEEVAATAIVPASA
jgi:transcriptional regulator with PAS, ATPase and Fis domain